MEEKINLVIGYTTSVSTIIISKKGLIKNYIEEIGLNITVTIEGTVSTNTIVFFVNDNNLKWFIPEEIEFIANNHKKVDDLEAELYNFIESINGEIKQYKECI